MSNVINHNKTDAEQDEEFEMEAAVAAFLKKGGKITKCEPGARTEDLVINQWGRKGAKKKAPTEDDE